VELTVTTANLWPLTLKNAGLPEFALSGDRTPFVQRLAKLTWFTKLAVHASLRHVPTTRTTKKKTLVWTVKVATVHQAPSLTRVNVFNQSIAHVATTAKITSRSVMFGFQPRTLASGTPVLLDALSNLSQSLVT
jgi:hypothetical protein